MDNETKPELKEKILKLQEAEMLLQDLKLYLDTHPTDSAMLAKYYAQARKAALLRGEIERVYRYPLTAESAAPFGPDFLWINAPWPWCPDYPGAGNRPAHPETEETK